MLSQTARDHLKATLRRVGLLQPIVWNKQTGHIVSGHQRVEILDDLEKNQDYTLMVAEIDIPLKQEMALNVLLNNPSAQGDWDGPKLGEVVKELNGEVSNMGFDLAELKMLVQMEEWSGMFLERSDKSLAELDKIREIKAARKAGVELSNIRKDSEFYCVAVFESKKHLDKFREHIGAADREEIYVNGRKVSKFLSEKSNEQV